MEYCIAFLLTFHVEYLMSLMIVTKTRDLESQRTTLSVSSPFIVPVSQVYSYTTKGRTKNTARCRASITQPDAADTEIYSKEPTLHYLLCAELSLRFNWILTDPSGHGEQDWARPCEYSVAMRPQSLSFTGQPQMPLDPFPGQNSPAWHREHTPSVIR